MKYLQVLQTKNQKHQVPPPNSASTTKLEFVHTVGNGSRKEELYDCKSNQV